MFSGKVSFRDIILTVKEKHNDESVSTDYKKILCMSCLSWDLYLCNNKKLTDKYSQELKD